MKECAWCHQELPLDQFYFHAVRGKYFAHCKNCQRRKHKSERNTKYSYRWYKRKLYHTKKNALARQLSFELTIDDLKTLLPEAVCVYCGSVDDLSIDRKDNSLGYSKANCVIACMLCNTIKGNRFSYLEMLLLGKTLSEIKALRSSK